MKNTLSTSKIISLVILLSIGLIASLFIYHGWNKPKPLNLSMNDGTFFPVARDIKPFKLTTHQNKAFTLEDMRNHWTLLTFGFTHCAKVCPTTLEMLKRVYPTLHKRYPSLQIALLSLDPERDSSTTLAGYMRSYHPNFIGLTGKTEELRKIQAQFNVFSSRIPAGKSADYQIQHSSFILLINPEGKWAGLFHYGLSPQEFKQAFLKSMRALETTG